MVCSLEGDEIKMKQKVMETIKKYNLINSKDKIVVVVSGVQDTIAM